MKSRQYKGIVPIVLLLLWSTLEAQTNKLAPWTRGIFDIHHISTGRGNATYMVFPDGTTMLFDAGEISDTHPRTRSDRNSRLYPDGSRQAYEWLAQYITAFSPFEKPQIDYGVISHFHDDHFGEWDSQKKKSVQGNYVLTGFTGVGDIVPIKKMTDRGHVTPINLCSEAFQKRYDKDEYHIVQTLNNYFSFLDVQNKNGMSYDSIVVGANDQFVLTREPGSFPEWEIKNIAAGGRVATGYKNRESVNVYPETYYPGENPLSVCLKIRYGKFDYFTGGDVSGIDEFGSSDFQSMEAQIASLIGAVDVATLNHHGNRDSQQGYYVRTLRPRVWVQQTWSSDHPGHDVLRRIMSNTIYPGPRDLFATDMLESNINVIGDSFVNRAYKAKKGHIVIRVQPGGDRYSVYVLNDSSTDKYIVSEHGPYQSR